MLIHPAAFDRNFKIALGVTFVWAYAVSEYIRDNFRRGGPSDGEAEAFLACCLWGLCLWWVSRRYSSGWNGYWLLFTVASFAPFADIIDASFGGMLGLRNDSGE